MERILGAVLMVALLAAACSSGTTAQETAFPSGAVAVRASADLAVGTERLLIGVSMPDGRRLGSPDDPVDFQLAPPSDPDAATTVPATFIEMIPGVTGVYMAEVEFDEPGVWSVAVVPEDGGEVLPTVVEVKDHPYTVAVGEPAPAVPTPTLADRPIEALTTDPEPMPALYERSLDEALADGRPTVVVFATPAFCQSAACGPMLDQVKAFASGRDDVDVVHVEVYEGFTEDGFVPDVAHLAPAVTAWGLPSEPWVFVVDAEGIVRARFEGVLGAGELERALG